MLGLGTGLFSRVVSCLWQRKEENSIVSMRLLTDLVKVFLMSILLTIYIYVMRRVLDLMNVSKTVLLFKIENGQNT